jgi:hypothetical protein
MNDSIHMCSASSDDIAQWLRELDSKKPLVASSAGEQISRHGCCSALSDAITTGNVRTALGRVVAINSLLDLGLSNPESIRAFRYCVNDRSDKVLSCALFGLVFMRDLESLPLIEQAISAAKAGSFRKKRLQKAALALAEGNPYLYSPNFLDARNVFRLPKNLKRPT